MRLSFSTVATLASVAALSACTGEIGSGLPDGHDPSLDPASCIDGPQAGPSPIRRMTRFEFDQTVRDLLGDDTHPSAAFPAEEEKNGFTNDAATLVTNLALVEKYMMAAEGISERATADLQGIAPCDAGADAAAQDACAQAFIETFGKRAFRRPLTDDDRSMLLEQFAFGRDHQDYRTGIRMVIETALQSPAFLYRVEMGDPTRGENDLVALTSWEMASRLSYFLWGTMPDDALFARAEADALLTPEQIADEARRMIESPKARAVVAQFHRQWLDYDRVHNITKDAAAYPEWSPGIATLMEEETERFLDYASFEGGGTLTTLLTSPSTFLNAQLAAFYGIEGVTGDDFTKVDLDPQKRAGVLTSGTFLSFYSHTNQTSPVLRGKIIREQLLCDPLQPPPNNADTSAPVITPGSTGRDRFEQHRADPLCAGCHYLMDDIGFGFENYDTVGRFRETEAGKPVDATGNLTSTDVDGPFVGVAELSSKLAQSAEVEACYAKHWFRFGYGRAETDDDLCTVDWLASEFQAKGGNIKELLISMTQTDAFLFRPAGGGQ